MPHAPWKLTRPAPECTPGCVTPPLPLTLEHVHASPAGPREISVTWNRCDADRLGGAARIDHASRHSRAGARVGAEAGGRGGPVALRRRADAGRGAGGDGALAPGADRLGPRAAANAPRPEPRRR